MEFLKASEAIPAGEGGGPAAAGRPIHTWHDQAHSSAGLCLDPILTLFFFMTNFLAF